MVAVVDGEGAGVVWAPWRLTGHGAGRSERCRAAPFDMSVWEHMWGGVQRSRESGRGCQVGLAKRKKENEVWHLNFKSGLN
jgi:hypothetical protein